MPISRVRKMLRRDMETSNGGSCVEEESWPGGWGLGGCSGLWPNAFPFVLNFSLESQSWTK